MLRNEQPGKNGRNECYAYADPIGARRAGSQVERQDCRRSHNQVRVTPVETLSVTHHVDQEQVYGDGDEQGRELWIAHHVRPELPHDEKGHNQHR